MENQEIRTTKIEKKGEKTMNIYEKIATIRCELQERKIKKSGINKFANFDYFTLEDLLPEINKLELKYKVFSNFSLTSELATLTITNAENTQEQVVFTSPVAEAQIKGTTPIQSLGGVHTYLKRYVLLNAYSVVENDTLDALVGTDKLETKKPQPQQTYRQQPSYEMPSEYDGVARGQVVNMNWSEPQVDSDGWFEVSYSDFKDKYNNDNYEKGKYDSAKRTIPVRLKR